MTAPDQHLAETVNLWTHQGKPFLLLCSFDLTRAELYAREELEQEQIFIDFPSCKILPENTSLPQPFHFEKKPPAYKDYKKSFERVMAALQRGDSYLINLTASSEIFTNASPVQLFNAAVSRYKILYKNQWLCFSPETFITIDEAGFIRSNPMKGTIDASLPDAENTLLNDEKEKAEHYTIVDLIRNDLSGVAYDVKVKRFRYVDVIKTNRKSLLQVSSEIEGKLPEGYHSSISRILFSLLPAGSVSGAPKQKTVEIIKEAETHNRGFYTGVAFMYNGSSFDSCVLIRFMEFTPQGIFFKSGGGITVRSEAEKEYQELTDKIYVPVV
ncbi:MAG: aminodeoxychorismate synthase component I [Chitinophagaceae bacterium]|nr:aminodeoxychorismate synthase component I [Chitinophagaceae bacterium]